MTNVVVVKRALAHSAIYTAGTVTHPVSDVLFSDATGCSWG